MNKQVLIDEAVQLLEEALTSVRARNHEKALWRIADAAGLLCKACGFFQKGNVVGVTVPTGRGYKVVEGAAAKSRVRKVG